MKLPVFDRAADYFRGDDSTLDASTPRELVEELRRADKLWFDCYGYHFVDFSIVDGLYETPGLEAEDMPPVLCLQTSFPLASAAGTRFHSAP